MIDKNDLLISFFMGKIREEYERAIQKNPVFYSHHEGYAILLEEVQELWDEIKNDKVDNKQARIERIRLEAIQVGAMALKMLIFNEGYTIE